MNLNADFDLSTLNTMGLGSKAAWGAFVTDSKQIKPLLEFAEARSLPFFILGEGSNVILQDKLEAVVAVMRTCGIKRLVDTEHAYLFQVEAGESWASFVDWTLAEGFCGLENLAGIPGTVGAAPIQNIGAYGLEVGSLIHAVHVYDTQRKEEQIFSPDACLFAYRNSLFKQAKNRYIVLRVVFALPKVWQPVLNYTGLSDLPCDFTAMDVRDRVLAMRQSKLPDPKKIGNVGSFFHNPIVSLVLADSIPDVPRYPCAQPDACKISAAWLIERCGFKGQRDGSVGVYDTHSLILVNHGGATFSEIVCLTQNIQKTVYQKFSVHLHQEPITF